MSDVNKIAREELNKLGRGGSGEIQLIPQHIQSVVAKIDGVIGQLGRIKQSVATYDYNRRSARTVSTGLGAASGATGLISLGLAPVTGGASIIVGGAASAILGATSLAVKAPVEGHNYYATARYMEEIRRVLDQLRDESEALKNNVEDVERYANILRGKYGLSGSEAMKVAKMVARGGGDIGKAVNQVRKGGQVLMSAAGTMTKVMGSVAVVASFLADLYEIYQLVSNWNEQHPAIQAADEAIYKLQNHKRILLEMKINF